MGKLLVKSQDDAFLVKMKTLFDQTLSKLNSTTVGSFNFETFIQVFDENDRFTKRLFEFMIKDMAHKYNRDQRRNNYMNLASNSHHQTNSNHNNGRASAARNIDSVQIPLPPPIIFNSLAFENATSRSRLFSRMTDSFLALTRRSNDSNMGESLRAAAESYINFHDDDDDDEDEDVNDGEEEEDDVETVVVSSRI